MSKLLPTNEIAARIMGNRKVFSESSTERRPSSSHLDELAKDITDFDSDSSEKPRPQASGPKLSVQEAIKEMKTKARGDNAAFDYPKATDSSDEKVPDHDMADQDIDDEVYGTDDQDSAPRTIKKTTESLMKKFVEEHMFGMDTFRHYAGLPQRRPLSEDQTGDVPTSGAHKANPMKAGLSGLEGQALQKIEPEGMEDDVGSSEYEVLDQAVAMLKKEGIDTDTLWSAFLEDRGLDLAVFQHLVNEAIDSDDSDEMDALIAVEELFYRQLPNLLPEGLWDRIRGKKPPEDNGMAQLNRTADAMAGLKKSGVSPVAIRNANARGVAPTKGMAPSTGKVQLARPADAPPEDLSPTNRNRRMNRPTLQMKTVKMGESRLAECPDDMPKMLLDKKKKAGKAAKGSKMGRLAKKYKK